MVDVASLIGIASSWCHLIPNDTCDSMGWLWGGIFQDSPEMRTPLGVNYSPRYYEEKKEYCKVISKVSRMINREKSTASLSFIRYLPVGPKKPVAWHSSRNTNALCFSAREHISLQKYTRNNYYINHTRFNKHQYYCAKCQQFLHTETDSAIVKIGDILNFSLLR